MTDGRQLLADLQPLRRRLEADLRERSDQVLELGQWLREDWQAARQRERTAQTYEVWREDTLAQAAVMWLLACVFVRFLEDNLLLAPEPPRLAGPQERLQLARDQRTLYFQKHPLESDRDYLYSVFEAVAALPAAAPLFDHRHNPIWNIGVSGDAATEVIEFWQQIVPATGALVYDFTDPEWETRFLGDLYQDLSESARKKYALLQTPDFVLQFILDRTLTPAIDEFGFREVRLIDPACGSGHFLLAAFERLFRQRSQHEPGGNPREQAQRALDQVSGVDLNPVAVAIACFRLLLAALRASNITRLVDAPAFAIDLAAGDSLLHGPRPGDQGRRQMYLDPASDPVGHVYATEDAEDLKRILGRRYHVVVGNPPYITPKDAALNKAYRDRFGSCHMKYSLAVPFTERLFDLAVEPVAGDNSPAGYIGMITANSFMKREFGRKLIEEYIPRWNLTHIIDTSRAHIPGHGTPTVILLGRHGKPQASLRAILGIRGESVTPERPAEAPVWTAIVTQIDCPGSQSEYATVVNVDQELFHHHPWSIGGGGATSLKTRLDDVKSSTLEKHVESIGFASFSGEDDVFILPRGVLARYGVDASWIRVLVKGEDVRDWSVRPSDECLCFYDRITQQPKGIDDMCAHRHLWKYRTLLKATRGFGGKQKKDSRTPWWHWYRWIPDRYLANTPIIYSYVGTHNHFALGVPGQVYRGGASVGVITFDARFPSNHRLALLSLLNSSLACFWLKQVMHDKGGGGIGGGLATENWEHFFEFTGNGLLELPVADGVLLQRPRQISDAAKASFRIDKEQGVERNELTTQKARADETMGRLVAAQEELDWETYSQYGLLAAADVTQVACVVPSMRPGERAFEISMARRIAAGELETVWFQRHGSTPITEIPAHWPEQYREVVERRIELIESSPEIGLIERREYKRRWNNEQWDEQVIPALREWLLDRLELEDHWSEVVLTSVARLADRAKSDPEFIRAATLYRGQDAFDVSALVGELVGSSSVPFLPVLRYKASGLRKQEQWERTWDLQRREDAIDACVGRPEGDPQRLSAEEAGATKRAEVGQIPVPPKYTSADFADGICWHLRGKLDVPKERFISYPYCERDADPTPVIVWAGLDHLQQAKALATYYVQMKDSEGWSKERLTPLLAGVLELLPWLTQWHNEIDPEYGQRMGDYFEGFVDEEARALGLTREAIRAWTPPAGASRRRRRRTTSA